MAAFSKARAWVVSASAAIGLIALSASARADVLFDSLSSPNSGVVGDDAFIASGGFAASFDTGASAVVLTAEDARRAGVETSRLVFDVPVATANGGAMAAEARLDQVAIGPIVMRNVPALVARRGALDESLLGMSFLERLKSYTVERDRLVMVAR